MFTITYLNLNTTQFGNGFSLNAKFENESTKLKISVISKEIINILGKILLKLVETLVVSHLKFEIK